MVGGRRRAWGINKKSLVPFLGNQAFIFYQDLCAFFLTTYGSSFGFGG
jgi:hypothetical protein